MWSTKNFPQKKILAWVLRSSKRFLGSSSGFLHRRLHTPSVKSIEILKKFPEVHGINILFPNFHSMWGGPFSIRRAKKIFRNFRHSCPKSSSCRSYTYDATTRRIIIIIIIIIIIMISFYLPLGQVLRGFTSSKEGEKEKEKTYKNI